jgi:hypothetical protein
VSLPAGVPVVILLQALHTHPDYWEDPERFDPQACPHARAPRARSMAHRDLIQGVLCTALGPRGRHLGDPHHGAARACSAHDGQRFLSSRLVSDQNGFGLCGGDARAPWPLTSSALQTCQHLLTPARQPRGSRRRATIPSAAPPPPSSPSSMASGSVPAASSPSSSSRRCARGGPILASERDMHRTRESDLHSFLGVSFSGDVGLEERPTAPAPYPKFTGLAQNPQVGPWQFD